MSRKDEEMELLMKRHLESMADYARSELERSAGLIEHFKAVAASSGIMLHSDAFSYIQTIGVVASAPGLAKKLLSITSSERDGLFAYNEIAKRFPSDRFQEGYFIGKDYMLMAHPCYRRRMQPTANWAPRFVALFWQLDLPNIEKFIAIDENRVRINVDGSNYIEADTWYGAPFNKDISQIENGVIKLRPPLDLSSHHIEMFFAQCYCLDVKWSETNRIKIFQALEVKTEDVKTHMDNQIYYPARYLHAEFDLATNSF
jgi:hypothetical protein